MSAKSQIDLLRVLETGQYTESENVIPIELPPLGPAMFDNFAMLSSG
jgi:hypothetical protein